MKPILSCLLAVGVVLLAGCSSTSTKLNTGTVHASTFSFVTGRPMPPDYAEKREQIHRLVQSAITTNLTAKGISRVPPAAMSSWPTSLFWATTWLPPT